MNPARDLTWPAEDFSRVPYTVFVDDEIYRLEQERIFRGSVWNFAGLEAEIPKPGDYRTTFIGDTPVVVNRGSDGILNAFVNRCAHRGTLLVRDLGGNADDFTCIYHHWCYDQAGDLVGVPFIRSLKGKGGMPADFAMSDHGLHHLKIASYRGVIFVSFARDTEPLEQFLDQPMREYFDTVFGRPIEILGYLRQRIPANWKLYYENLVDDYHGGLLHPFQVTFGIARMTQGGGSITDKMGRHRWVHVEHGTDSDEEAAAGYAGTTVYDDTFKLRDPSIADFRDEDGDQRGTNLMCVFPNALFQRLSSSLATRQIRTHSAGMYELFWTVFGYADDDEELRQMRMKQINLVGPSGLISMEDGEAGRLLQLGIKGDHADAHSVIEMGGTGAIPETCDHFMTEISVRAFWRYWCDLMEIGPQTGISKVAAE